MRKEFERKITHLIVGSLLAVLILCLGQPNATIAVGAGIAFGLFLSELLHNHIRLQPFWWFIQRMEREGVRKPGVGTINFFLGAFIALIFFDAMTVFVAVLILSFGDSFAAIVGKCFGKHRISKGKSIEGAAAGFIASFLVCLPYVPVLAAAVTCAIASLAELLIPIDDNITIPPIAAIALRLTQVF
jgi:dolichol kinase